MYYIPRSDLYIQFSILNSILNYSFLLDVFLYPWRHTPTTSFCLRPLQIDVHVLFLRFTQSIMEKRIKIIRVALFVKHKYICWKSNGRREEGCVNTCALTHYACVRVYGIFLFHLSKPFHITGHILFLQNGTVTILYFGTRLFV